MADYRAPLDDIRFAMYNVFDLESFWAGMPALEAVDRDTADAILEEAAKLCEQVIAPLNRDADEAGCGWSDGDVTTPKGFKEAYQTLCDGGWVGLGGNPEYDGLGMPKSLASAVEEMVQGSCMAFGLAPMLTAGACLALDAHGDDSLKSLYLPKLYSGLWAGAMDLTEPHAGTDLGLIRTKAMPQEDGSYQLTGTKIFITWGEHDMAENIVHLVLAKLPDAPAGSKGISLFLVPKFLPNANGELGERNGVTCGSLEKKMGIKASATCVMNFDGATGWLVGQPNSGLACMFTMMNYERLVVGIQAVGAAEASYQNAKAYAQERLQSRGPNGVAAPDREADPIIVHPDVRRMLLTMKTFNEASRAFYLYVAMCLDEAKYGTSEEAKLKAKNKVALLTPISKAFISDLAFETAVHGQQVLGGHGYVREWGQEQYVRDIRITQIYEGTNGIQAMDLVGRKTISCKGALLETFLEEAEAWLMPHAGALKAMNLHQPLMQAFLLLRDTTQKLVVAAESDPNVAGAAAVDYLNLVGTVIYGYMWARMAVPAAHIDPQTAFYSGKIKSAQFYFDHALTKTDWLAQKILKGTHSIAQFDEQEF